MTYVAHHWPVFPITVGVLLALIASFKLAPRIPGWWRAHKAPPARHASGAPPPAPPRPPAPRDFGRSRLPSAAERTAQLAAIATSNDPPWPPAPEPVVVEPAMLPLPDDEPHAPIGWAESDQALCLCGIDPDIPGEPITSEADCPAHGDPGDPFTSMSDARRTAVITRALDAAAEPCPWCGRQDCEDCQPEPPHTHRSDHDADTCPICFPADDETATATVITGYRLRAELEAHDARYAEPAAAAVIKGYRIPGGQVLDPADVTIVTDSEPQPPADPLADSPWEEDSTGGFRAILSDLPPETITVLGDDPGHWVDAQPWPIVDELFEKVRP